MSELRPKLGVTGSAGRVSRYRVELPKAGIIETGRGHFEATEFAERRTGLKGRFLAVRDFVTGATLSVNGGKYMA